MEKYFAIILKSLAPGSIFALLRFTIHILPRLPEVIMVDIPER
jgi:hypothetical protein